MLLLRKVRVPMASFSRFLYNQGLYALFPEEYLEERVHGLRIFLIIFKKNYFDVVFVTKIFAGNKCVYRRLPQK